MKIKNIFVTLSLLLAFAGNAFGDGEISAINITRIMHPCFHFSNQWSGGRNPWNRDYTRIMLVETGRADIRCDGIDDSKDYRGMVWGFIDETAATAAGKETLQAIAIVNSPAATLASRDDGSLADYLAARAPVIPDGEDNQFSQNFEYWASWSEVIGEEHIIYATGRATGTRNKLYKVDTDLDTVTLWVTFPASTDRGGTVGWHGDGRLIVGKTARNGDWAKSETHYLVNVETKAFDTISTWPAYCDTDLTSDFPSPAKIHSADNEAHTLRASYHASPTCNGLWVTNPPGGECTGKDYEECEAETGPEPKYYDGNSNLITHISWNHDNNDWWLGSQLGQRWARTSGSNPPPYIDELGVGYDDDVNGVFQLILDTGEETITQRRLTSQSNTGYRRTTHPDHGGDANYSELPSPTISLDGEKLIISGTGGTFSWEDMQWCQVYSNAICTDVNSDWALSGAYVADLILASNSTTLNISRPDGDEVAQAADFNITYTLYDSDDVVTVTFYYDTDNADFDGTIVPKVGGGTCSAQAESYPSSATCAWDTGAITPGEYWVYGITTTGEDNSYSVGSIMITSDTNNPPTLSIAQPGGGDDSVTEGTPFDIIYTLADGEDVVTAAFYYDGDEYDYNGIAISGPCATAAEGTGATCAWNTTGMPAGSWFVYGITDDGTNPAVKAYSATALAIGGQSPPSGGSSNGRASGRAR